MRDRHGGESESAGEDRPQRPAGRGARRGEPPDADRRERCRRGGSEPEVDVSNPVGDARERADEEDVVRAVVPAAWVEERIAEQPAADRRESSLQVDGDDECARTSRAKATARVSEHEMDQEREGEAGGERAEAQYQRRPASPAGPERREPDKPCKQGQVADPSGRPGEGHDDTGRHERDARDDGEGGSEVGAPGIGRQLARAARDSERTEAVGERDRPGGEPSDVRPADGTVRHRRDCGTCHDWRIGAGHNRLSGQPRCTWLCPPVPSSRSWRKGVRP